LALIILLAATYLENGFVPATIAGFVLYESIFSWCGVKAFWI
jgi:hypothetical protein